jgi:hypothetical protein
MLNPVFTFADSFSGFRCQVAGVEMRTLYLKRKREMHG